MTGKPFPTPHHRDLTLASVTTKSDDGLEGRRGDVVGRWNVEDRRTRVEVVHDPLFVRAVTSVCSAAKALPLIKAITIAGGAMNPGTSPRKIRPQGSRSAQISRC